MEFAVIAESKLRLFAFKLYHGPACVSSVKRSKRCEKDLFKTLPLEIAVAIGSNLGDRRANLTTAVSALKCVLQEIRVSDFVETVPEGGVNQPDYLNAAVIGRSEELPMRLMEAFQDIERSCGRTRPYRRASRTLDIDLILMGDIVIKSPRLEVPHPRFRDRSFVLEPLCSIAPDLVDPITGATVLQLSRTLREKSA